MSQSWETIEERGNYRVLCDQDEMAHTNPDGYADTMRGAEAMARHSARRYGVLSFSIEERTRGGFFRFVKHIWNDLWT